MIKPILLAVAMALAVLLGGLSCDDRARSLLGQCSQNAAGFERDQGPLTPPGPAIKQRL